MLVHQLRGLKQAFNLGIDTGVTQFTDDILAKADQYTDDQLQSIIDCIDNLIGKENN